ncbi:MAG: PspA/IM30 family protein, partial [Balneolaceae bacterium]
QLEKARENLAQSNEQLKFAEQAYEKSLKVKQAFMREKDKKIRDAREALRASERAEWQAKIADTLEQFEVGGLDQTYDEMMNRLNEQTAKNEARMEIALESVDTDTMEIEANAEKLRAQELVKQFKAEMGVEQAEEPERKKDVEIDESAPGKKESEKTVGKSRTKS